MSKTRVLKSEVQELEELEREKEKYFASEIKEMEGFKEKVGKFSDESRREVLELRNRAEQVNGNDISALFYFLLKCDSWLIVIASSFTICVDVNAIY